MRLNETIPTRSADRAASSSDDEKVLHYLSLARDAIKQLNNRALILLVPLIVSTYSIHIVAEKYIHRFDLLHSQVKEQTREKKYSLEQTEFLRCKKIHELNEEEQDKLSRLSICDQISAKARDDKRLSEKLTSEGLPKDIHTSYQKMEIESKELWHKKNALWLAVREAEIDLTLPGGEKKKLPFFFAMPVVQFVSLAILLYLLSIRRNAVVYLIKAASFLGLDTDKSKFAHLAAPNSPLLFPLPASSEVRSLLDAEPEGGWNRLPLLGLLAVFCILNGWLLEINWQFFRALHYKDVIGNAIPMLLSLFLTLMVTLVSIAWWFSPPRTALRESSGLNEQPEFSRRLVLISMLVLAGAMVVATQIPSVERLVRQLPYKVQRLNPRFRRKKVPLQTSIINDGFLFNAERGLLHFVSNGWVRKVQATDQNLTAFAEFKPVGILISESNQLVTSSPIFSVYQESSSLNSWRIANGQTIRALEREIDYLAKVDLSKALNRLLKVIRLRLPKPPFAAKPKLDTRLFDLYAKLAVSHFDEKRLKELTAILIAARVAVFIPERMQKWLDDKSKWRKRTQNFGRYSNVRYPDTREMRVRISPD